MTDGKTIVERLKKHVADTMKSDPRCGPTERGLGNIEIEELRDLALHLDSQDHYLTYSVLHSLIKEGAVEQVRWPDTPRHPKYRLRSAD